MSYLCTTCNNSLVESAVGYLCPSCGDVHSHQKAVAGQLTLTKPLSSSLDQPITPSAMAQSPAKEIRVTRKKSTAKIKTGSRLKNNNAVKKTLKRLLVPELPPSHHKMSGSLVKNPAPVITSAVALDAAVTAQPPQDVASNRSEVAEIANSTPGVSLTHILLLVAAVLLLILAVILAFILL